jgi:exodeoxyribonuclease VII large subunit
VVITPSYGRPVALQVDGPNPYAFGVPLQTSPDQPAAVRTVAQLVGQWVDRLGSVWIEGQVAELKRRPGAGRVFITLRDTAADLSLPLSCQPRVLDAAQPVISEGDRILVWAKPSFYPAKGSFSLAAREIRHVGLGELLARLERLRSQLATEGLFAPERKRAIPFLPRKVGLVCGRASAAERDVIENAVARWPGVDFDVREVAVQGPSAAAAVTAAIKSLDADSSIDVIVVTRGGGSAEDLLPFSEETLLRVVAAAATPIVSAIGHEQDSPLLDFVADVRASTPTDAARRIVPNLTDELRLVQQATGRLRSGMRTYVTTELRHLTQLRGRPVLAAPRLMVDQHQTQVATLVDRSRRAVRSQLDRAQDGLEHTRARVTALSPQATLDRGYAVVQKKDGSVVREPPEAKTAVSVRVASGSFAAVVAEAK